MEEIIFELDKIARDYNHYEFGLPTHNEEEMSKMISYLQIEINKAWEAGYVQAEKDLSQRFDLK